MFLVLVQTSKQCPRNDKELPLSEQKSSHSQSKRAPTLRAKELPLSEQESSHLTLWEQARLLSVRESPCRRRTRRGLDPLLQVLRLDEVTQLSILVAPSNLVQVQQTL